MTKLNMRAHNTLYWTQRAEGISENTRLAVLRELESLGMLEVRVTAKGLAYLNGHRQKFEDSYTPATPYAAQVRHATRHPESPDKGWMTLARDRSEYLAAEQLWESLQRNGFRTSEIPDHIQDLAKGHVLSTERGVEFRVLRREVIEVEEIGEA